MSVYYQIVCDELNELIEPDDIDNYRGIQLNAISDPENPFCAVAIFAMAQLWNGRPCRISNDSDIEDEICEDYKDITEFAIKEFNKVYPHRKPLVYSDSRPRPLMHMSTDGQPPLCGATKEPIYVSDNKPLNPNGRVTCFTCLSLVYGKKK